MKGRNMVRTLRQTVVTLLVMAVLTGIVYPLLVTGIARGLFAHKAGGSMIVQDEKIVGSELIGQPFSDPGYFWSRPSATSPVPYDASASSGSNLGPTNPALLVAIRDRVAALRAEDPGNDAKVPVDLVTASGSGLDPHITPAAAEYQVARVARVRGMSEDAVRALVAKHTQARQWGVFGEPRVNVLELNLALDSLAGK
jgi:potassium-transporting ATPase KdpC subunit